MVTFRISRMRFTFSATSDDGQSYEQNLWIAHLLKGAAYLPS